MEYYCGFENGIKHGDYVEFHENGCIKFFVTMWQGSSHGKELHWYKNGNLKSEAVTKYGYDVMKKEWDEDGKLVKETFEPNEHSRKMIEKYDRQL